MPKLVRNFFLAALACLSFPAFAQVTTAYPDRTAYQIKGVFSDHQAWGSNTTVVSTLAGNRASNTAINLFWPEWQSTNKSLSSCTASNDFVFDGACFQLPAGWDSAIAAFTAQGVRVTGIIIGVPDWAARPTGCSDGWCPPEDTAAFRRFVRLMARRYNGQNGHGRIADFVIGNEVSTHSYFKVDCPASGAVLDCSASNWIARYADYFANAYDVIKQEQSEARAMVSLADNFFPEAQHLVSTNPEYAGSNFLSAFAGMVGTRTWYVAMHPYSRYLGDPNFDAKDYQPGIDNSSMFRPGRLTFGNIGAIAGFLWKNFPNSPAANYIHLTEQGFSNTSLSGQYTSSDYLQANAICRSYFNALGTPSITNYIYHRLVDNAGEAPIAGNMGLWSSADPMTLKPAWTTWAVIDAPSSYGCGFDQLPNTLLQRSYNSTLGQHWVSSRLAPAGYVAETSNKWHLVRNPSAADLPNMTQLFECGVTIANNTLGHTVITADNTCGRTALYKPDLPLGPVGYVYKTGGSGRVALYSCKVGADITHIVSSDPGCEGQTLIETLGYALP